MNLNVNWGKLLDTAQNKSHIILAAVCQGSILFMHWHYGKDLSPNVKETVNWFYLFLAGHFSASQVWPDKDPKDQGSSNAS